MAGFGGDEATNNTMRSGSRNTSSVKYEVQWTMLMYHPHPL